MNIRVGDFYSVVMRLGSGKCVRVPVVIRSICDDSVEVVLWDFPDEDSFVIPSNFLLNDYWNVPPPLNLKELCADRLIGGFTGGGKDALDGRSEFESPSAHQIGDKHED